jgi:N-acetylglucosamine malate deacetylase 2
MRDSSECAATALLDALCATGTAAHVPPSTMVVAAHPDDETVGAGSRLPRLVDARFVYVTDGAPLDGCDAAAHGLSVAAYATLRQQELEKALALCGIPAWQLVHLRCPDQEAALRLAELAHALQRLFHAFRPAAVLTHPYEGGHPDHDAAAFAVHAAAQSLRRAGEPAPVVLEMTSYHLGSDGLQPGNFLPVGAEEVRTVHLTPEEQRRKRALFDCFATQSRTLAWFPLDVERFRRSPAYDFRAPPHGGPLFYEGFPWGMSGARFCALAEQAMVELGARGPL